MGKDFDEKVTKKEVADPVKELAKQLLCAKVSCTSATGEDNEAVAEAYRLATAFENYKGGK